MIFLSVFGVFAGNVVVGVFVFRFNRSRMAHNWIIKHNLMTKLKRFVISPFFLGERSDVQHLECTRVSYSKNQL